MTIHPHSTPRPWTFGHVDDTSYDLRGADKTCVAMLDGRIECPPSPEDAVLIAHAVNNHEVLVAALERMLGPTGYTDDNSITRQAKAALAKAAR